MANISRWAGKRGQNAKMRLNQDYERAADAKARVQALVDSGRVNADALNAMVDPAQSMNERTRTFLDFAEHVDSMVMMSDTQNPAESDAGDWDEYGDWFARNEDSPEYLKMNGVHTG